MKNRLGTTQPKRERITRSLEMTGRKERSKGKSQKSTRLKMKIPDIGTTAMNGAIKVVSSGSLIYFPRKLQHRKNQGVSKKPPHLNKNSGERSGIDIVMTEIGISKMSGVV